MRNNKYGTRKLFRHNDANKVVFAANNPIDWTNHGRLNPWSIDIYEQLHKNNPEAYALRHLVILNNPEGQGGGVDWVHIENPYEDD